MPLKSLPLKSLSDSFTFTFDVQPSILHDNSNLYYGSVNLDGVTDHFTSWDIRKKIHKVIFNGPATIVIWTDGTKTVVKCMEGDAYSKEAGFALCVLKRILHNDSEAFHKAIRGWCKED